jgi:hypothetical protein
MKKTLLTATTAATLLFNVYSDIVLNDTPQVVVGNYQSTPANTSLIVGRNSTFWDVQWGTGFKTGDTRSVLHSALFLYNGAWPGTTGGFRFALHTDDNGLPGGMTALLQGPDRPVNGYSWYAAADQLVLEANTVYWLVASAPQTESPRFFEWRGTTSGDETSTLAGWELLNNGALRTNEGAWSSSTNLGHTAIQVEAVPEPTTTAFVFSALGLLAVRRIFH